MAREPMELSITREPFPARTRTAAAAVNGVHTEAMSVSFADKILVTISQGGKLAHWLHVPLDVSIPEATPMLYPEPVDDDLPPSDLLPMSSLTATTVLGGRAPEVDTFGQLLATQIASAIKTKNSEESRMVIFGFGLNSPTAERGLFLALIGLALEVL